MKTTMNVYTHTQSAQHQMVANQLNQALVDVIKSGQADDEVSPDKPE